MTRGEFLETLEARVEARLQEIDRERRTVYIPTMSEELTSADIGVIALILGDIASEALTR